MLRTHVSFESSPGENVDVAAAAELALQLLTALKKHGVAATAVRALDYAQEFELRQGGRTFYSMLGPANDEGRQWLWFADSTLGALARLVGRRDESEHVALLQAMDAVLRELGMNSIRWYTAADWNEAPAERWHRDPCA
jgi:hypothetical protein